VTEAFAWLLKTNPKFSEYYIKYICRKLVSHKLDFQIDSSTVKWDTQVNFSGRFPDLIYEAGGKALVFEHKLFSNLHDNQLLNYRTHAEVAYEDYRLILLTANTTQHQQNPDLSLCWEDIHKLIEKWIIDNGENSNKLIFYNFLRLLEFEGLGPKAPISHESILYYFRAKDFETNVHNLMQDISQTSHKDFTSFISEEEFKLSLRSQWGRIGVELHNSWGPCLFAGVICGGHRVDPILGPDSPDVVLMLCFDSSLHETYKFDQDYKDFVKELRDKSKGFPDGWEIHLHLEDETKSEKNMWHPVYIRKPFVKMMAGTKNTEEQKKAFVESIQKILPYYTSSEYFQNMRSKWGKLV